MCRIGTIHRKTVRVQLENWPCQGKKMEMRATCHGMSWDVPTNQRVETLGGHRCTMRLHAQARNQRRTHRIGQPTMNQYEPINFMESMRSF